MRLEDGGVKLRRGTAVKIATRLRMSVHHVNEFAKGNRPGSEKLYKAVMREHVRQQTTASQAA